MKTSEAQRGEHIALPPQPREEQKQLQRFLSKSSVRWLSWEWLWKQV